MNTQKRRSLTATAKTLPRDVTTALPPRPLRPAVRSLRSLRLASASARRLLVSCSRAVPLAAPRPSAHRPHAVAPPAPAPLAASCGIGCPPLLNPSPFQFGRPRPPRTGSPHPWRLRVRGVPRTMNLPSPGSAGRQPINARFASDRACCTLAACKLPPYGSKRSGVRRRSGAGAALAGPPAPPRPPAHQCGGASV